MLTTLIIWPVYASQLQLTPSDKKYPHIIHVDKGNSEHHQQEESVEASLTDSMEGKNNYNIYISIGKLGFDAL
jgi:hypothetical protein